MKRLAVGIFSGLLNAFYALCRIGGRRKEVLFLSRQSDGMSADFKLLARALSKHEGWSIRVRTHMVGESTGGLLHAAGRMFGDAAALARCKLCFVEGYNPGLSLLNMKCEAAQDDMGGCAASDETPGGEIVGAHFNAPAPAGSDYVGASPGSPAQEASGYAWRGVTCKPANSRFPIEPLVIQVWHAGGLFKSFGYLALDTPEGRNSEDARLFHMHRNYSWVICSGEGAREGFAAALSYPVERVIALGHPSFDELFEGDEAARARVLAAYPQLAGTDKPIILFAPTLHRTVGNQTFEQLAQRLAVDARSDAYEFVWSYHPVSAQLEGKGKAHENGSPEQPSTRDLLRCASLVITDYSSIVFDAALLGKPFAFYVPDIDEYRTSPGLAVDPAETSPHLCTSNDDELFELLGAVFAFDGEASRGWGLQRECDAFIGDSLSACEPGAAERIVDFALAQLGED